ncbi:DUF192 domain-containing protein [Roseovarius sp. CAU 1744]|uniref:DUF192 domain-containing protein n=1 Tax=Roseovarius sp. CAU 1744 TaxID=3140368 RepID=UPI00325ADB23
MGNRGKGIGLGAVACLLFSGAVASANECRDDRVLLRGDWGQASFTVEVADDEAERNHGLMFRDTMPKSAGMLFVYPAPSDRIGFWMKNTLIPLDMIFLDETGTVRRVHSNAVPHDESPIMGGPGIMAVLEVNGGMAEIMGIAEGSQMRHPAFDPATAVWPC